MGCISWRKFGKLSFIECSIDGNDHPHYSGRDLRTFLEQCDNKGRCFFMGRQRRANKAWYEVDAGDSSMEDYISISFREFQKLGRPEEIVQEYNHITDTHTTRAINAIDRRKLFKQNN